MPINGYPKFKSYLVEFGIRQEEVAEILGMSREKLNTILNGRRNADFSMSEIIVLADRFKWSPEDVDRIFFTQNVANMQR
ncbi:helix-turn-helix domain-containing protein [Paenisporosarcina cavernae]|uniref:XRE family transcriptional regulator n=1 Tax=Paenisporosarcina cavernae TaxID=2320858 RepID=A0A385YWI9_9BACL|nr:helix-turn-helix transcriptional regulator [Paenisporosarcina cavernae]AYC30038.1 XRE family transcriptional regulator [Paenisporosarcina cavernae]